MKSAASDRRIATIFALVAASGFSLALLAVRVERSGMDGYDFLVWNLFLAWVPFALALAVYDFGRRGSGRAALGLGALWLLFLPNAPYIVTDLVHVGRIAGAPVWFDAGLVAAFAATGLLLGLCSILLVQRAVAAMIGAAWAWALLAPVLLLCSAGVGLGRFGRLNSWDALSRPDEIAALLLERLSDPLAQGRAFGVTIGFTLFLGVAYLVVYTLSSPLPESDDGR